MPGRYGFVSEGAQAGEAIQQFLIQRELMNRQARLDEQASKRDEDERSFRERDAALRERTMTAAAERQARLDAEHEADRARGVRADENATGVRRMIADRLGQGPLDANAARQLSVMGYAEGVGVPGIVEQAMQPPKRIPLKTRDAQGHPMQRSVTEDELAAGVPLFDEDPGFTLREGQTRFGGDGRVLARAPGILVGPKDNPLLPRGIEDYLASMKRRGYTRAQADAEVGNTWDQLRRDHPHVSALHVEDALRKLYPEGDLFDGGGGGPIVPTDRASAGVGGAAGGRTATSADVAAVAQRLRVSPAEAQKQLEARGIRVTP